MARKHFIYGAFTLFLAGLISRVLGAVHRVLVPRILGAEAVGLLQMAYPVYSAFLVLAISGVPVAVSRLIAEEAACGNTPGVQRVFRVALAALWFTGLTLALLLYGTAPYLARFLLGDPSATLPLQAIAPSVCFLPLTAVFRGYFQGRQEMLPSALGQILEQIVRVTAMVALAVVCRPLGLEKAAAGAAVGTAVGSLAGLVFLVTWYCRVERTFLLPPLLLWRRRREGSVWDILWRLWETAWPAAVGAMIMPLINLLDALLVPRRLLALGYTAEVTRHLYGELTGMAMALVYFPTVLTLGLAGSLVPAVTEAITWGQRRLLFYRMEEALQVTMAWALPCAVGLGLLATPICLLLFGEGGAGEVLTWLAPAVAFICLQETTVAILQGLGRSRAVVRNMVLGALFKAGITYVGTGLPWLGIKGAAVGTILGFAWASLRNLKDLQRYSGYRLTLVDVVGRPLAAVILMGTTVRPWYNLGQSLAMAILGEPDNTLATGLGILGSALVYFTALLAVGGLPDILVEGTRRWLPKKKA